MIGGWGGRDYSRFDDYTEAIIILKKIKSKLFQIKMAHEDNIEVVSRVNSILHFVNGKLSEFGDERVRNVSTLTQVSPL